MPSGVDRRSAASSEADHQRLEGEQRSGLAVQQLTCLEDRREPLSGHLTGRAAGHRSQFTPEFLVDELRVERSTESLTIRFDRCFCRPSSSLRAAAWPVALIPRVPAP